jgi:hypothetical protein
MRRLSLLALLLAYLAASGVLFAIGTVVPYAQLALYAGLESAGRAHVYLDVQGPIPRLGTPALVFVCRDLVAKPAERPVDKVDVGNAVGGGDVKAEDVRATDGPKAALKTLKACEPSLLARGDSVDLALLGRQHAYLWTATKEAHHKDSALRYISRSAAASPRRADAAALNAQSLGLLSP